MRSRQGGQRRRACVLAALAAILALAFAPSALADPPPPGAAWHEEYFEAPDGTRLHADVLRPKQLPKSAKTPVILSVGPYFNHSGQVGPLGPVQDAPYQPAGEAGPSSRFFDFVEGARLMERGYTFVMVDLRGFGGSSGCLDWSGPGEQMDVKAAVEWAAGRPWSTGRVGMYGKSYDGVTGLIGVALRPRGLAGVVSQEPVYDLYRYLYSNRVRFSNSLITPGLYDIIAASPGAAGDSPEYQVNAVDDFARPGCPALNYLDQQERDPEAEYWQPRNLIPPTRGSRVPLFLTQGFLENNTKPDGAFELFNGVRGPKRAWFGMWDHVRGNDTDGEGRLAMGRKGWFDEVMRFFDRHVKRVRVPSDPPVVVQSSDGRWRAEDRWPPRDSRVSSAPLRAGSYTDHGLNNGTGDAGPPNGDGLWTFSPPFAHEVHLSGEPRVSLDLGLSAPDANVVVALYDVDRAGSATLISRGTYLVPESGKVDFELYGDDWILPAGHRLGVLATSSNAEWWAHVPTGQTVEVRSGAIDLPFLGCARTEHIQGDPAIKLEDYRESAPFEVPAETIQAGTDPAFPVPPPLRDCGAG